MSIEYVIEIFDPGPSFGPGTKVGELWGARNVGWSAYDRRPGKAFATLPQGDAVLALLEPLLSHVKLWRISPTADKLVFSGGYVDYDATGDDVVVEFFDYLALLGVSRSGFKSLYPSKKLGTEVVTPEWTAARTATYSPLGFVATGTIENPLATDGTTEIVTSGGFGTLDQMRLQLFYDLSEIGRANTTNHVSYGITREAPHTFSFLKNAGSLRDFGLILNGNVSDYRHVPLWKRYRNDLATLGLNNAGGPAEIVKTNETEAAAKARRQDVFTIRTLLGIAGAATEADQQQAVAARELMKATKQQPVILLRLLRGALAPFDGWDINDRVPLEIGNGIDSITGVRRIVGVRTTFDESGENMSLITEPLAA